MSFLRKATSLHPRRVKIDLEFAKIIKKIKYKLNSKGVSLKKQL